MKWTTEKPTKEGWYFVRRKHFSDIIYWVDENYVYLYPAGRLIQSLNGFIKDNPGIKFAGPIEEPKDNCYACGKPLAEDEIAAKDIQCGVICKDCMKQPSPSCED